MSLIDPSATFVETDSEHPKLTLVVMRSISRHLDLAARQAEVDKQAELLAAGEHLRPAPATYLVIPADHPDDAFFEAAGANRS